MRHRPINETFYPEQNFEIARNLEQNYLKIRQEFDHLFNKNVFRFWPQKDLNKHRKWTVFQLYNVKAVKENCELCPFTYSLIKEIPGVYSALFSVLESGSHIPPHTGPDIGYLNCHLGLKIPDGCAIRVGKDRKEWKEGKTLVFDDRHEHEVWNNSELNRAVFMVFIPPTDFNNPRALVLDRTDHLERLRFQMIKEYYENLKLYGSEEEKKEMHAFFENRELTVDNLGLFFRL